MSKKGLEEYKKRVEKLTKAIELDKGNAKLYKDRGLAFAYMYKHNEAIKDYNKAMELDKSNAKLYKYRAMSWKKLKKPLQAFRDFNEFIRLNRPDDISIYKETAELGYNLELYKEAEEVYSRAIEIKSDDSIIYARRGLMRAYQNKHKAAIEDYNKAIEYIKDDYQLYERRGLALAYLDRHKEAISDYTKAIELNKNNYKAYRYRAMSWKYLERYENAIQDYTKAISLKPEKAYLYVDRGFIYIKLKQYKESILDYSMAIKTMFAGEVAYDNDSLILIESKKLTIKSQKYKEYVEDIIHNVSCIISEDLDIPEAYNIRAILYIYKKKYKMAIDDLSDAIRLNKVYTIYNNRAIAHALQKDYQHAIKDYTQAINLNKENAGLYIRRGFTYYLLGEFDNAIRDYSEAIRLEPNNATAYKYRAKIWEEEKGEMQKADDDYTKAIELNNNDSESYVKRASIRFADRNYIAAMNDIKKALEIKPDDENIKNLKKTIEIAIAKEEERDRIIANISHSIKNLIASVQDPLEYVRENYLDDIEYKNVKYIKRSISNAIRGLDIIRNIVVSMYLPQIGSVDDFYKDAKSSAEDKMPLSKILLLSIKDVIPNVFDGKYLSQIQKNYFPTYEEFKSARENWEGIADNLDINTIKEFINNYLCRCNIKIENIENLSLSNAKNSVFKLSILFQEIILNALKYSSYVNRRDRFIDISLYNMQDEITFSVKNSFNPDLVSKREGLGMAMIEAFGKLLGKSPRIEKQGSTYIVEVKIPNFWKGDNK